MRRGTRTSIGVGAALALWATGCQWMPHQRVDRSLDPRQISRAPAQAPTSLPLPLPLPAEAEAVAVAREAAPLPETPLRAISDAEALAAAAPAPTPLLDAAVAQAQAVQDVMTGASAPDPEPAPEPVTLAVAESPAPELKPDPEPVPAPAPEPAPAPAAVSPEEQWRTRFEALQALARSREAASDGEPWPLRAAVLEWLGEGGADRDEARAVIWSALLESLAQATSRAESEKPPTAENPALREAIDALEERLPLRVGALAICRKVQGFGQYEPIAEPSCRAGQTVVLYCELEGLRYEPEEGEGGALRSRLESTVVLRAAEGDRVYWSQSLGTAEDVCRRRRRDYYVNYRITLPDAATLPPGTYRLQVLQRDVNANTEATAETLLHIAEPAKG